MPRKFTKRKRYIPKRKFVKKFPITKPMFPLQKIMRMQHRYCDAITLNPGDTVCANYYFRANSVYDPDYTSTGHSAMYVDQIGGVLYNGYIVTGSKITVSILPTESNDGVVDGFQAPVLAIKLDNNTTPTQIMRTIIEQKTQKVRYKMVQVDGKKTTVIHTWSLKKDEGERVSFTGSNWTAAYNGDPASTKWFNIAYGGLTGSDELAVKAMVVVDYSVLWFDPIDVAES